jgi:lipopolysaccharide heptosyltransferase I
VPEQITPDNVSAILVVKPSALGDIVHSMPFLNALRNRFTDAEIHWVVARGLHGLLEGHPLIDRVWVINKDQWKKINKAFETVSEIKKLFTDLKKEKFDIAVDLQGLMRSGLITMASRAGMRLGFSEAREGSTMVYTHRVKGGKDIHAVDRYMKMAEFLGCDTRDVSFPMVSSDYPLQFTKYAVLMPGAKWTTKRWPAERFGELSSILPINSVVIGGRQDKGLSETVVSRSGGKAISLAGRTDLRELAGIIKGADFMVSNDTGPMHIAAALNVPVFAIFGPTSPVRTGPYGNIHTVIRENISCSPCYRRKCGEPKCMEAVTSAMVYDIIREKMRH